MGSDKTHIDDCRAHKLRFFARPQVISIGLFVFIAVLYLSNALEFLDFHFMDVQFQIHKRPSSQTLVVVEIDSVSIKELEVWPWSRSLYAKVVDKIIDSGANNIIIDIDFSSPSTHVEDQQLLQTFKQSKTPVFLPVFQQWQRAIDSTGRSADGPIVTMPYGDFLPNVKLASSNYSAESDGLIRVQSVLQKFRDGVLPTMAAATITERDIPFEPFFIDFGIQPDTVPRISFSDVLSEKFDPGLFNEKRVIIGATALELGDIKPVPVYHSLAGPMVVALGYDSIFMDRMLQLVPLVFVLGLTLAICLGGLKLYDQVSSKTGLLIWFGANIFVIGLSITLFGLTNWILEVTPLLSAVNLTFFTSLIRRVETQSLRLIFQSLSIRRSDLLMRTVVENSFDGIIITDARGFILKANPTSLKTFDYNLDEIIGSHVTKLFADLEREGNRDVFPATLPKGKRSREFFGLRSDGVEFNLEAAVKPMHMDNEENFAIFVRDITSAKKQEQLLQYQAHHDALTDLPNRILLNDRLDHALKSVQRTKQKIGLLLLDLDHFKEVNDTLGHAIGDELLSQVAKRLSDSLRDTDTVSRLGGDEFAILVHDIDSIDAAGYLAKAILINLRTPFQIGELTLSMEASIGIVLYPDHGSSIEKLFKRVDIAMYKAKREKCGFAFYDESGDTNNIRHLVLSGELRNAIEARHVFMNYQPQINLKTDEVIGVEALMRWNHGNYGLITPQEFIGIAERSGLIHSLTNFALDATLAQAGRWLRDGLDLKVSVNLSMLNLKNEQLSAVIEAMLSKYGVPPENLVLEVTESTMMTNPKYSMQTLDILHKMGILISIDDFGTGHSSLQYIKDLPINEIKIDRSFVVDMKNDDRNRSIVKSIIVLAQSLNLEVVAEGVETKNIAAELASLGCDTGQGFCFAKPLPGYRIADWIKSRSQSGNNVKSIDDYR